MKKYMIKLISMFLVVISLLSCPCFAFAAETVENNITTEVIPNEVVEAPLPPHSGNTLNGGIELYGISKPGDNDTYDLSSGRYDFTVTSTLNTTIYSKYVFTGHGGKLYFYFNDTSSDSNGYTIKVYKKGGLIALKTVNGTDGNATTFSVSTDEDAKVYFAVIPKGTTYISGYVEKITE